MSGFFHDINLCAIHRKVVTIGRKDIWLAVQIRGREHVGGRAQVSDVGNVNFSCYRISDRSEKQALDKTEKAVCLEFTGEQDWNAELRSAAVPKQGAVGGGSKGGKGGKNLKRIRTVLLDNLGNISKPAICRLARRGGVKRMSGLIYDEIRGAMKIFLQLVVRDVVSYTEYSGRKTVTAMDVIYALKRHGRNMYGFM